MATTGRICGPSFIDKIGVKRIKSGTCMMPKLMASHPRDRRKPKKPEPL
jgi:hypothetical protein